MLSDALTSVLRSGREHWNAEFASARRRFQELDGASFSSFLAHSVDPLVRAVGAVRPERVPEVVMGAYEVGLELVGLGLAGPKARQPFVDALFQRLLPAAAAHVAESPRRLLTCFSNAVHTLVTTPGGRAEQWLAELEALAPRVESADLWLALGQVCAWRSGLAHYRSGALAACDLLPEHLAREAFRVPEGRSWPELRALLESDPWFDPAAPARGPRVAMRVGAFRGFGGLFTEPPRVLHHNGQFVVASGSDAWLVTSDTFGATLHRARAEEVRGARFTCELPPGVSMTDSELAARGAKLDAPLLGALTSAAFDDRTLALTCSLSHVLVLVAYDPLR